MSRTRIPTFVNPAAGGGETVVEQLSVEPRFDIRPTPALELTAGIKRAVAEGARRVAVAGGDGTVGTAAAAVAGTGVELAILPTGTLNHFARDYQIPLDLDRAVDVALGDSLRAVDLGMVNGRYFLNTSSVGTYVVFVRLRERLERRLGYRLASALAALRLFLELRTFRVELELEGNVRHYTTPLVFVGVSQRELGLPNLGMRVTGGRAGLHLIVVRGRTRARIFALALAAAARGYPARARGPHLDGFLIDRCRIHMPRRRGRVALDGELVLLEAPLEYRLAPGVLTLVAPPVGEREGSLDIVGSDK